MNEQELLSREYFDKLLPEKDNLGNVYSKGIRYILTDWMLFGATQQVAKLKAMGWVSPRDAGDRLKYYQNKVTELRESTLEWDREKVAEMFCGRDWNTGFWETRTDYGKEQYYKLADQLKEILTGT